MLKNILENIKNNKVANTLKNSIIIIGIFLVPQIISIYLYQGIPRDIGAGVLIYISLISIVILMTKKASFSFILVNILEYFFAIISYIKLETRWQVFEPWDLTFVSNAGDFISFDAITLTMIAKVLGGGVITAATTFLQIELFKKYCAIPSKKISKIVLGLIAIMSILFFSKFYIKLEMKYVYTNENGYNNFSPYKKVMNYSALGNFIIDIALMDIKEEPKEYSEDKMKGLFEKYIEVEFDGNAQEYDNVIVVLLESFVDVTKIKELTFKKDPLSNFHKYANETNSGWSNVTNIGGGTSNIEYQALTMFSVGQYPEGIYPYIHCIKNNINVLPQIFKENGYETTGIHPFNKGFYSRDSVYPYMGIEKFISDEDFENPIYENNYISDMESYKKIVELIENEEKSFITLSTMATHPTYSGFYFEEYDEWIENEKLTQNTTIMLNNYLQKLRNADKMLGKLIEYVNDTEEKTLLIVYGDHYPLMYGVYKQLGMIPMKEKDITSQKYPELFKMPYMVISNCEEIEVDENVTPAEFGIHILENVELSNIPWYYKVVYDYQKTGENYDDYIMIQYDEIFGKKYWKNF